MDSGTLIYLVAVIIYFIYTALKKNKKGTEEGLPGESERPKSEREAEPAPPARSFEEMLKEIRREQQGRSKDFERSGQKETNQPHQTPQRPSTYADRQENERRKEKPIVIPEPNIPKAYQNYTGARASERGKLKTLDEQVDIDNTGIILGDVEPLAEVKPAGNRYAALLRQPQTLKDAIVVSEILQKKYF
ncbi:hypothetical protein [Pararhodonellum marinum]|uniref:hypothetical protein n=1 Tax=Pararhodonellum marinum TaxID=2755358 RepID=UPI00188F3732|nr:hypothetical protein [Pararhodonellum marinum]